MEYATANQRVLVNRKGQQVITNYTDAEAFKVLEDQIAGGKLQGFAVDLVSKGKKYGLSEEQYWWVHRLAVPREREEIDCNDILQAFLRARSNGVKQRNMKVDYKLPDGTTLRLALASQRSKNAGCIYVTDDGTYPDNKYYGKIDQHGFFSGYDVPLQVSDRLHVILENIEAHLPW